MADADDAGANAFLERVENRVYGRLMDRASFDREHRVAARRVVLEDVDRLVTTGPRPRHPRRPLRGRVEERPVDGMGAVLWRHGPAFEVVVPGGHEAQRAADGLARERWHASRVSSFALLQRADPERAHHAVEAIASSVSGSKKWRCRVST